MPPPNEMISQLLQELIGPPEAYNNSPNMPPMQREDDENGYWDAQHMGNGRGQNFMMKNGQRMEADPTGNGAVVDELMQLILGNNPNPADGDPHNNNPNQIPLAEEDGEMGYWDAQHMGNGRGESFINDGVPGGREGPMYAADPVGNGVSGPAMQGGDIPQIIQMLMKLSGGAR